MHTLFPYTTCLLYYEARRLSGVQRRRLQHRCDIHHRRRLDDQHGPGRMKGFAVAELKPLSLKRGASIAGMYALSPFVWEEHGGYSMMLRIVRSEEHTSELQSLMRISYAVFCLTKKNITKIQQRSLQTLTH